MAAGADGPGHAHARRSCPSPPRERSGHYPRPDILTDTDETALQSARGGAEAAAEPLPNGLAGLQKGSKPSQPRPVAALPVEPLTCYTSIVEPVSPCHGN